MGDLTIAVTNRTELARIKRLYDTGQISREKAVELAQPVIDRVNKQAAEVAKKYGKSSYLKLDFVSAMRNPY